LERAYVCLTSSIHKFINFKNEQSRLQAKSALILTL
jgi:hypothetical protein